MPYSRYDISCVAETCFGAIYSRITSSFQRINGGSDPAAETICCQEYLTRVTVTLNLDGTT